MTSVVLVSKPGQGVIYLNIGLKLTQLRDLRWWELLPYTQLLYLSVVIWKNLRFYVFILAFIGTFWFTFFLDVDLIQCQLIRRVISFLNLGIFNLVWLSYFTLNHVEVIF